MVFLPLNLFYMMLVLLSYCPYHSFSCHSRKLKFYVFWNWYCVKLLFKFPRLIPDLAQARWRQFEYLKCHGSSGGGSLFSVWVSEYYGFSFPNSLVNITSYSLSVGFSLVPSNQFFIKLSYLSRSISESTTIVTWSTRTRIPSEPSEFCKRFVLPSLIHGMDVLCLPLVFFFSLTCYWLTVIIVVTTSIEWTVSQYWYCILEGNIICAYMNMT